MSVMSRSIFLVPAAMQNEASTAASKVKGIPDNSSIIIPRIAGNDLRLCPRRRSGDRSSDRVRRQATGAGAEPVLGRSLGGDYGSEWARLDCRQQDRGKRRRKSEKIAGPRSSTISAKARSSVGKSTEFDRKIRIAALRD